MFNHEVILDFHSHHAAPYPEGIISVGVNDFTPTDNQCYSVGVHPWDTAEGDCEEELVRLERLAVEPAVVAIGECGVDLLRGAPLYRQLLVFRRQAEIAERVGKPLVLHVVKSADIMLGLKRDLQPSVPWIVHGFRGNAALARQLLDKGFYLSYGERFNAEALKATPEDRLLAETDESPLSIGTIIVRLSDAAGRDLRAAIAANTSALLPPRS